MYTGAQAAITMARTFVTAVASERESNSVNKEIPLL